tara:strand:- start:65 stop:793 length:729 start_codon:yes stop_codon:yes gene_type:complete
MGLSRGIDIVTDNLMVYIDAANKRSYPGSGTTVNNLMDNNSGTLVNGTAFSTNNKGYFDFDGTNDYINLGDADAYTFGDGSNDSTMTVSAWVNMDDASGFSMATKYFDYAGEYQFYVATDDKLYWVVYDDSVGAYGAFQYIYTGTVTSLQGQWVNFVGTYDGRGGNTAINGLKIYINGVQQSISTATYDTYVAMENTTLDLHVGRINNGYSNGKIAILQLYKKELSVSEILQNYNALKDRFI